MDVNSDSVIGFTSYAATHSYNSPNKNKPSQWIQ